MPNSSLSISVEALVKEELNVFGKNVITPAKQKAKTSEISSALSHTPAQREGDRIYFIDLILDLNIAPEGAAYEFGSGLHRTKGQQKTYKITPKNTGALKFPFTLTYMPGFNKLIGLIEGGKIVPYKGVIDMMYAEDNPGGMVQGDMLWSSVDHPGVEAKPALMPSIELERPKLRKRLADAMIEVLHEDIRQIARQYESTS